MQVDAQCEYPSAAARSSHACASYLPGHRLNCQCHPAVHTGSKDQHPLDPTWSWQDIRLPASEESTCQDCVTPLQDHQRLVPVIVPSITQIVNKFTYSPQPQKQWQTATPQIWEQCAPLQAKDIISAFKTLLDIINGNINLPRKPTTSRRPHHTSHRGTQSHGSLTLNTCSPGNLLAYQISHITHRTLYSSQKVDSLQTQHLMDTPLFKHATNDYQRRM